MSRHFMRLLPALLWLAVMAGLAVILTLLLRGTPGQKTGQAPEPTPASLTTDQPTVTLTPTAFDSPLETPTPGVTETPVATPTPPPTDTTSPTPTPKVTPTPIPGDEPIPIEDAPAGELLLYEAWQGVGETATSSFRILPLDSSESIVQSVAVDFSVDFDMFINSVSPDGRYILLIEKTGSIAGGRPHVYDRETSKLMSFFEDSPWISGLQQDWSLDNKKLLFWSDDIGGLWLLDVETGEEMLLTTVGGTVQGASIAPSGQQIAFIDSGKNAYNALWIVDARGEEPQWIFDIHGPSRNYGWSSKGILYLEGSVGTPKGESPATGLLWAVEPGKEERLNFDAPLDTTFGFGARLSPDRTKLAFTGIPNEAPNCTQAESPFLCLLPFFDIYVLDILDNEIINLGEGIYPEWSPNGQNLAFISYRTGHSEAWIVNSNGSDLRQVSNDGREKSQVFWLKGKSK